MTHINVEKLPINHFRCNDTGQWEAEEGESLRTYMSQRKYQRKDN